MGLSDDIKKLQDQLKSLKEEYSDTSLKEAPLFKEDIKDAEELKNSISQMKVLIKKYET